MTQGDGTVSSTQTTTVVSISTTSGPVSPKDVFNPVDYESYPYTDTIAAATIAVLAVVIIITLLLVFRALRKRRRARQGEQFGQVQTLTTGIMGTGVAAYSARTSVPVHGSVSWQSVNPSS